jgi:hypothetical protein
MLLFWSFAASATATVPSPSDNSLLKGASCAKPSSCWAVGSFQTTGGGFNQALRWNGKHWTQGKIPQPGGKLGTENNALYAISCPAASNCWAVGSYNQGSAKTRSCTGTETSGHGPRSRSREATAAGSQPAERRCVHLALRLLGRGGVYG